MGLTYRVDRSSNLLDWTAWKRLTNSTRREVLESMANGKAASQLNRTLEQE